MHPKLLELTVQRCREHMAAGDCHGEAPPSEHLIAAVVQLSAALTGAQPAPRTQLKDHEIRELVGYLVHAAEKYRDSGSLRDRISDIVLNVLRGRHDVTP